MRRIASISPSVEPARPDGVGQVGDDAGPDPRIDPVRDAGIGQDLRMVLGERQIDQHAGLLPGAGEPAPEELARGRLVCLAHA